jgi:murein DD-endopeptidase MepM/ murein hydrolase activator NlpD
MGGTLGAVLAEKVSGAQDLYAALTAAVQGMPVLDPAVALPALLAQLAAGDDVAQHTAQRLRSVDQGLLRAVMAKAAGWPATQAMPELAAVLARAAVAPLFQPGLWAAPTLALPTDGSLPDMPAFSDRAFDGWFAARAAGGLLYGLGLYGERRSVYATDQFADAASPERRTRHLGIDIFAPAGTPLHAPLPGRVLHVTYNADPLDYGHTLILSHEVAGIACFTLYGHLGVSLPGLCRVGQSIAAGQPIAHLGDWHENGGWAPHLHFQVMSDMLEQRLGNFFGVGHDSLWPVWADICPDPNLILRLPATAYRLRG